MPEAGPETGPETGEEPELVFRRDGRVGRILLNRPRALNALTFPMLTALTERLEEWRDIPEIHAVVVEGAGGRAFCSGGDIRTVRGLALAGKADEIESFFATEYALNRLIAEYPKPYVALVDGVCMGGGMGLAVHGAMRVASEGAAMAMPETGIALFPDIGASHFLPRLPGALGFFLGLTGTPLRGADAVHGGLATHFVPRAQLPALSEALARDGVAVVAEFVAPLPPFTLAPHRATLDRCFGADSVPAILAALEADGGDWARETLATLRARSPSALLWSFALIRQGAHRTLHDALQAELALTRHVIPHPDFAEGVRAMVIDKDRQPRWNPPRIEEVDPAIIAAMFA